MSQHQAFAMPFEVGFVIDFDIDDELIPKGCGQLDEKWCNNFSEPGCSEGKVDCISLYVLENMPASGGQFSCPLGVGGNLELFRN